MKGATTFGELLRFYRKESRDPERGGSLSQVRFVEKLEEIAGLEYSYPMVSNWERNKSRIDKDDRSLLKGIIQTLYTYGGIQTKKQANQLLETGHYSPLNHTEIQQIFGTSEDDALSDNQMTTPPSPATTSETPHTNRKWRIPIFSVTVWGEHLRQTLPNYEAALQHQYQQGNPYAIYTTLIGLALWPLVDATMQSQLITHVTKHLRTITSDSVGTDKIVAQLEQWKVAGVSPSHQSLITWVRDHIHDANLKSTFDTIINYFNVLQQTYNILSIFNRPGFVEGLRAELIQLSNLHWHETKLQALSAIKIGSDAAVPPSKAIHETRATANYDDEPHIVFVELLNKYFNDDELRGLCHALSIDYESLGGEGKRGKIRELYYYCQRHVRLADLERRCQRVRPFVKWPNIASLQ